MSVLPKIWGLGSSCSFCPEVLSQTNLTIYSQKKKRCAKVMLLVSFHVLVRSNTLVLYLNNYCVFIEIYFCLINMWTPWTEQSHAWLDVGVWICNMGGEPTVQTWTPTALDLLDSDCLDRGRPHRVTELTRVWAPSPNWCQFLQPC